VSFVEESPVPFLSRKFLAFALMPCLLAGCTTLDDMSKTQVQGVIVTESMLAKVTPGTSQQTVLEELGTPSATSALGFDAFYYVQQIRSTPVAFLRPKVVDRRVLAVYFEKGKVNRVANYGLEDGVVFDYISRTTPVSGDETGFIMQFFKGMMAGVPGLGR
jgi:outer membrane protein assembly factor BamE (lipoprotein component of BamABCDE complex)